MDLDGTTIVTERLSLTALTVEDADEMVGVLGDARLHEFVGGQPATLEELRARYRQLVAGSGDPAEWWGNWVVRTTTDGRAVGTVQATVAEAADGALTAEVAWVTGLAWQGQGFATEAARALVDWLHGRGVAEVTANIHPAHHASAAVARGAGFHPTGDEVDGETVWRRGPVSGAPRRA